METEDKIYYRCPECGSGKIPDANLLDMLMTFAYADEPAQRPEHCIFFAVCEDCGKKNDLMDVIKYK